MTIQTQSGEIREWLPCHCRGKKTMSRKTKKRKRKLSNVREFVGRAIILFSFLPLKIGGLAE